MADTLEIFGTEYTGVAGIIATNDQSTDLTYIRPQGTKSISANGTGIDVAAYASVDVAVPSTQPNLQAKTNISPTTSSQTIQADSGYDGLSSVQINAMPSGTAGTPTATKGTVSNHSISVTPSVTNTEGYISGGTINGTAVTVSASELVSGTYTVDSSGTKDVTNYASASVPAGTAGTPSASKGAVSNHSVSVTPSVTNTTGWITGSTKTGTAVTVTASELASGNKAITQNGTNIDVVGYSTVSVNVAGAEYTRTVVCPQQTVSSSSRIADLANFPDGFIAGDYYIVTYDGTEYLLTAETMWSSAQVVGDFHIYYEVPGEYLYPFAMGSSGNARDIAMLNTSQHTVKVEHLELITGGTTLTTKNITTNGTYNASSDSADGYSSVTVNVPTGTPTIQSLTVNPSTTQQTFNASGVDGYKPVTVSAVSQTNLTAANIKNGTTVTISNGTSNIYSVTGTYEGGGGSSTCKTATMTNSSDTATSIQFTELSGEPKWFFVRLTSQLTRSSSYSYYYVTAVRYNGTNHNGNYYRRSNGTYYNDTTHYSHTYSNGTLTVSSSAGRGSAGGSFYNGGYELVYIY